MENHSFDRLLRAAHTGRDPRVTAPDCLDAETLAAWMSDQLAAPQRAHAEAHVAGCARCQSMLAMMARAEGASGHVAGAPPRARFWRMLPWAVPLTAAATAAALWLAVRPNLVQPVRNVPTNAAVAQSELASAAASARPAEPSPTVPGERAAGASSSSIRPRMGRHRRTSPRTRSSWRSMATRRRWRRRSGATRPRSMAARRRPTPSRRPSGQGSRSRPRTRSRASPRTQRSSGRPPAGRATPVRRDARR